MLKKSQGIVLSYVKYSESSIISKIYTKEFGLQSYVVKGVRSKKSKAKIALFEALSLVEIIAYQNENKTIHNLKEIRMDYTFQSIPLDVVKRSILFFLDEMLMKTLKEESSNPSLFQWLHNSLVWFDLNEASSLNFHLVFITQLTRFLGFYPKKDTTNTFKYFDLESGAFVGSLPKTPNYMDDETSHQFHEFYEATFDAATKINLSFTQRRKLLDKMVLYYRIQFPGFGELKSLDVLKMVLS